MSAPGLFVVGALVTLIVAGAISMLVYAAILDGRDERVARDRGEAQPARQNRGSASAPGERVAPAHQLAPSQR